MRSHSISLVFHHLRFPCESGGLRSFHILNSFVELADSDTLISVYLPSVDPLSGKRTFAFESLPANAFPDNVKFIFINTTEFQKRHFLPRLFSYIIYSFKCSLKLIFAPRYDGYLVTTYSLPVLVVTSLLSIVYRSKLWVEVRDMFGESLTTAFPVSPIFASFIIRLYKSFERFCLSRANLIIPNSPGFVPVLLKQYNLKKENLLVAPLGTDVIPPNFSYLLPSSHGQCVSFDSHFLRQYSFSLVYCGSLDFVHNPSYVLALCESISRLPVKISVNLFGSSLAHASLSEKFSFVHFHGLISKSSMESILPLFDASIYSSSEVFPYNAILGNKIFDYMKAELPILFLSESTAADFCINQGLGFYCNPSQFNLLSYNSLNSFCKTSSSSFKSAKITYNSASINSNMVSKILQSISS